MKRAIQGLLSLALLLPGAAMLPLAAAGPARAETISETCMKDWTSNAEYKTCLSRLTKKQSQRLKGKACSKAVCIYRLKATSARNDYGDPYQYRGSGHAIDYSFTDTGRAIELRQPSGAVSHFSQCGTCSGLDHEDGPADKAEISFDGKDIILSLPK